MGFLDFLKGNRSLQESGALAGAADCHSHILWGVDDGVRTLEETLDVLTFEESLGVTDVWCTPHIMEDVPNTTESLKARFAELQAVYEGTIRLHLAAEYMMDNLLEERLASQDLLLMDDDTLLVETSTVAAPYDINGTLSAIQSAGYMPLLAHPERCRFLGEKDFVRLHSQGVRFQMNLGSIVGYYGPSARRKAEWILEKGWYSAFGSDCHRLRSIQEQFSRKELSRKVIESIKGIR